MSLVCTSTVRPPQPYRCRGRGVSGRLPGAASMRTFVGSGLGTPAKAGFVGLFGHGFTALLNDEIVDPTPGADP